MSKIPEVFAIFEQKLAHVLSFTVVPLKSKDLKNALEEILTYFSGIVERASKAESRIAELSQAVGLITTLKPTMVMDVDHPLDMAKEVEAYVTARLAELEAAQRWIPVSERLPEEDTDGNTLMAICRHSGEWVRAPFGAEFSDEFVRHYSYWMYAPQPPEVQE